MMRQLQEAQPQLLMQQDLEAMSSSQLRNSAFETIQTLTAAVNHEIIMKPEDVVATVGMIATGRGMFKGTAGKAKTKTTKLLARSTGGSFARIQGRPDNQPSDVVGTEIYNQATQQMEFRKGPALRAHFLLGDELNRNPEKTQAPMLEFMEEGQVTVNTGVYEVLQPFTFIATQNPNTNDDTNELPIPQLDRFHISVTLDKLSQAGRIEKMRRYANKPEESQEQVDLLAVSALRLAIGRVAIPDEMYQVIDNVCEFIETKSGLTIPNETILDGRAPLHMMDVARYHALTEKGKANVDLKDVYFAARYALPHRITPSYEALDQGIDSRQIVETAFEKKAA